MGVNTVMARLRPISQNEVFGPARRGALFSTALSSLHEPGRYSYVRCRPSALAGRARAADRPRRRDSISRDLVSYN